MSLSILARATWHTLAISLPTVFEAVFSEVQPSACDRRLDIWSRALLRDADVRLEVEGLEHIRPDTSYVVMSNHQSLYDIPVLFQALPLKLRMAAKAELFRVPIWGRALTAAEFVRIDRKRGPEARQALLRAGWAMKRAGVSLWVAPEGTRSPDGELLPFKTGAFALAHTTQVPILPVRLDGTRSVLRKHGRHVARGMSVRVSISEPILPSAFPGEIVALAALVRAQLLAN